MRNNTLFVSECHFEQMSPLVGNYEFEYLIPFIIQATDLDITEIVGEALMKQLNTATTDCVISIDEENLIDNYIQPALVAYTMFRSMNFLSVKPDNSGLVRRDSQNGTAISMDESSFLADSQKTVAEMYGQRLADFLCANREIYPDFGTEVQGEQSPTDNPSFTGGLFVGAPAIKQSVKPSIIQTNGDI